MNEINKLLTNGPNNARRVVWACFRHRKPLHTLNTSVGPVNTFNYRKNSKTKKKNTPRAQMTHLASFAPFSIVTCFHLSLRRIFRKVEPIYTIKYLLVLKNTKKNRKKLTYGPNESFGPVFVVVALHWPIRTVIRSVVAIYIV